MRNEAEVDRSADVDGDSEGDEPDYKTMMSASEPTRPEILQFQTRTTETRTPRHSRPSVTKTASQDTETILRSLSQKSQVQSSINSAPIQGPIESAIWDRQASSINIATHSDASLASKPIPGYSYEPQGELLLQGSRIQGVDEFNIPNPVFPPNTTTHRHSNPLEALLADNNTSSTRDRGVKRKSAPDLSSPFQLKPGSVKRPALDLGEERPAEFEQRVLPHSHALAPPPNMALPARKVFPIQIGDKLFRLSGASISSDGK